MQIIKALYVSLFILGVSFNNITYCQVSEENEDVVSIIEKLPSLQVLIDSAIINSPLIKFQNAEIIKSQFNIRLTKSKWSQNFGISGNLTYGTYDYLSWDPITNSSTLSNRQETRYGTGLSVRLPLYDLLNSKNELAIAKIELEQAKFINEQKIHELRQIVITQYNTVVLNYRLVNLTNKNQQSSFVQYQTAEKQYLKGLINIEEFARVTEMYSLAVVTYERTRIDFTISYQILQEVVGMKFTLY